MGRPGTTEVEMKPYLDLNAEAIANCGTSADDPRMKMYTYMVGSATLAKLLHVENPRAAAPYRISRNVYQHRLQPS
jgi:hypothetical protein